LPVAQVSVIVTLQPVLLFLLGT